MGTQEDTLTRPQTSHGEPGDHDRFSHYLRNADWMRGYVEGAEVEALCGHRWVPGRDPKKYPVCPECKEIHDSLPPGDEP